MSIILNYFVVIPDLTNLNRIIDLATFYDFTNYTHQNLIYSTSEYDWINSNRLLIVLIANYKNGCCLQVFER